MPVTECAWCVRDMLAQPSQLPREIGMVFLIVPSRTPRLIGRRKLACGHGQLSELRPEPGFGWSRRLPRVSVLWERAERRAAQQRESPSSSGDISRGMISLLLFKNCNDQGYFALQASSDKPAMIFIWWFCEK